MLVKERICKGIWLKAIILSVSFVAGFSSSASIILGELQTAFPNVSLVTLQSFVTYPTIMAVVFAFIGSIAATRFTEKKVLLTGLFIFTVSGLLPIMATSFTALLAARLAFGAGLGLISPLSVSMISDYFTGDERMSMLGCQFAIGNLGLATTMVLIGWLAQKGWRYGFAVYGLGAVAFLLIKAFLPPNPVYNSNLPRETYSSRKKYSFQVEVHL